MILLSLQNITKAFGIHTVLDNVNVVLQEGQKTGLVGNNGTGKTTLLKIIMGEMSSDSGQISHPKGLTMGYLAQDGMMDSRLTVWEELLQIYQPLLDMEQTLRDLELKMGVLHDQNLKLYEETSEIYGKRSDEFAEKGGYSYRSFMQGVLIGLQFTAAQFYQPICELSGGQKTRVALAKLLLIKPDLLLLDEPTNHLDLDAIQWLESYLQEYKGTLLVISHDRYFLDRICDNIAELSNRQIYIFKGNYSQYLYLRTAQVEQKEKEYQLQQKEISRQQAIIDRYRSFNREKSIKAAESREKALNRLERVDKPIEEEEIDFSFHSKKSTGKDVLTVESLSKSFGEKQLFHDVSFAIKAGDRVVLLGQNGVGKSTLFKILLERLNQDTGDFTFGSNVQIGYYDQEQADLMQDCSVLDEVWDSQPKMIQTQIRNALAAFLFQGDDVFQPIRTLSGGEKGRVMLVKLMLAGDNVLLLDEPTNHLDMNSKERLESALRNYTGTIFTITHDRYFMNQIANRIFVLEQNGITEYLGNYDDYIAKKAKLAQLAVIPEETKNRTEEKAERRKEREEKQKNREYKEWIKALESSITQTEAVIQHLEEEMCHPEAFTDVQRGQKLSLEYKQKQEELDQLYEEWTEALDKQP